MLSQRVREIQPSATLAMNARRLELAAEGKQVINFSVGEPDFDTPEYICDAAKKALDDGWTRYTPVAGVMALREAVAELTGRTTGLPITAEQVIITSGAKQALSSVLFTQVDRGDEVLIPAPYWVSYPEMVRICEGTPVAVSADAEQDYKVTPANLESCVTPRTVGLILNSPSNPTGSVYTRAELDDLIAFADANDLWILSDEIYERFTYDGDFASALTERSARLCMLVNGLSKSHAMTGWRIGWVVADRSLISTLSKFQGHTSSNAAAVSQAAALAALTQPDGGFLADMLDQFRGRRELVLEELARIPGVRGHRPGGAFYVFADVSEVLARQSHTRTDGPLSSQELCLAALTEAGVAMVPGEAFGAPGTVRLSFACSRDEIRTGIRALGSFFQKISGS